MHRAEVDWSVCRGCRGCPARRVCKTRAIMPLGEGEPVFIELDRCTGCGKCLPACAFSAIALKHFGPFTGLNEQETI